MTDKFVGGIRIQFPNAAGVPVQKLIEMPHRPYRIPFLCPQCGVAHPNKMYHLELDAQGITIVSREVVDRLREGGIQFEVLNVVRKPPKIKLNVAGMATVFRVEERRVPA